MITRETIFIDDLTLNTIPE